MVTPQRCTVKAVTFWTKVSGTRHKRLQRRPHIIIWGLFFILGCPLRIFHHRTVIQKKEQNVPQMSQQIGNTWEIEVLKALVRSEAKNQPLTGGLVKPQTPVVHASGLRYLLWNAAPHAY